MITWEEISASILAGIGPEKVRQIAKDYDLDYVMLSDKLPQILHTVSMFREMLNNAPVAKEARRHINEMRNAAAALRQQINAVPVDTIFHAELFSGYKRLYMLKGELDALMTCLDNLDPAGWKQSGNKVASEILVRQLAELWRQETGTAATSSNKAGQFLAFMTDCANIFDIDSTPLPACFARLRRERKGTELEL